jgi:hypothetical protein
MAIDTIKIKTDKSVFNSLNLDYFQCKEPQKDFNNVIPISEIPEVLREIAGACSLSLIIIRMTSLSNFRRRC